MDHKAIIIYDPLSLTGEVIIHCVLEETRFNGVPLANREFT